MVLLFTNNLGMEEFLHFLILIIDFMPDHTFFILFALRLKKC